MDILYRALRKEEIEKGNILLPKSTKNFKADNFFPLPFEIIFGKTEEHAVRQHQWNGKIPTRGISTTPIKEIAFNKYGKSLGVIVIIDQKKLKSYGISEYSVNKLTPKNLIYAPEDEEIILVCKNDGPFPSEIIIEIIKI